MKIAIGCDHGAIEYKDKLVKELKDKGYQVKDFGCYDTNSVDYPDYSKLVAKAVSNNEYDKGIVLCGTGIGVSIVANKFDNIRCALVNDPEVAIITREHNDSNVLAMGARVIDYDTCLKITNNWLETKFTNEKRHIDRINKIKEIENER